MGEYLHVSKQLRVEALSVTPRELIAGDRDLQLYLDAGNQTLGTLALLETLPVVARINNAIAARHNQVSRPADLLVGNAYHPLFDPALNGKAERLAANRLLHSPYELRTIARKHPALQPLFDKVLEDDDVSVAQLHEHGLRSLRLQRQPQNLDTLTRQEQRAYWTVADKLPIKDMPPNALGAIALDLCLAQQRFHHIPHAWVLAGKQTLDILADPHALATLGEALGETQKALGWHERPGYLAVIDITQADGLVSENAWEAVGSQGSQYDLLIARQAQTISLIDGEALDIPLGPT